MEKVEEIETILENADAEEIVVLEENNQSRENNYNNLQNKPRINNVTLQGNLKSEDLGVQRKMREFSNLEIDKIFNF